MYNVWAAFGKIWELDEKVSFNGLTKTIHIHPGLGELSIQEDIYSAWKRWAVVDDHAKFPQAMRNIGGDDIGGGQKTGAMFFLMNGWQILVYDQVALEGILYHDDGISPFVVVSGGVTNKVASLAYAYSTSGTPAPTTSEILAEIETSTVLAKEASLSSLATTSQLTSAVSVLLTSQTFLEQAAILSNQLQLMDDKLKEVWQLHGLDTTALLTVSKTLRSVGTISQTISNNGDVNNPSTTIQRT